MLTLPTVAAAHTAAPFLNKERLGVLNTTRSRRHAHHRSTLLASERQRFRYRRVAGCQSCSHSVEHGLDPLSLNSPRIEIRGFISRHDFAASRQRQSPP